MNDDDRLPPEEADRRRDAVLRHMLKTPPQPHKDVPKKRAPAEPVARKP